MLLEKVEMKGFKSFADQVEVDFDPAITGVIGPNGSGKSNIADAVRWVLGEQSAKALRGSKMKDVIFAGSEQRNSLSEAEVSLILDNSQGEFDIDYDTVKITRQVSQDGRSDYLINNNRCRLKDIKTLLLDTGIGKEAYSIIGQGKVDAILNGQATDRRELFEEAAGITEHKQRKEEAVDKLEDTDQKLQRIEDIVNEIERQLDPLAEEAKKAKEYKEYQGQLEDIEVNLLLNKYANLEDELDDKIATKQQLSHQVTNTKAEVSEQEMKLSNTQDKLDQLITQLEEQRNDLFTVRSKVDSLENKLELTVERRSDLKQRKEQLKEENQELEAKIELAQEKIADKEERQEELVTLLTEKEQEIAAKKDKLEEIKTALTDKLAAKEELRDNHVQQTSQINNQQYQLETINKDLKRYQEQKEELVTAKKKLNNELEAAAEKKENQEEKLTKIKENLSTYQQEYEEKSQLQEKLEENFQELETKYQNLKQKVDNKKSRLQALEGLAENYDGYYRGVKKLLQAADNKQLTGICGVVANLIDVNKKHETAIEVALGSALQNIIVENDQAGEEAIEYLKQGNRGRATLLPLNIVSSRNLNQREKKALQVEGAIGRAADLIDYDEKYAPAIENLLGRVIIASNISQAVEVSKAAKQRVKVVSLEGEIVRPGGAMTGGSYNQNNNLLGRSREIKQLKQDIKQQSAQLQEIGDLGVKKQQELQEIKDDLEELEEQLHQLQINKTTVEKDYQQVETKVDRLQEEVTNHQQQLSDLTAEISELKTKQQQLTASLDQLSQADDLEEELSSLEAEIKQLEEEREATKEQITDLKVKIASLEQQQQQATEAVKQQTDSISQFREEINQKEAAIVRLEKKAEQLAKKREELLTTKQEKQAEVTKINNQIKQLQTDKRQTKQQLTRLQDESQEVKEELAELQEEYNQVEVKVGQLEVKLDNIADRLEQEYQLEVSDKLDDRTEISDYKATEKKIKKLKSKLKALEPVNLGAIEEYDSLSERYDFLQEQHQDLLEAKESLQKVINEINQEMRDKLGTTFQEVKQEFETIFTDLFEGGVAELALTDKDNILTTEIEINAQPPGKQLQKLSLMSGGEKALTATALIFALLQVNPSPFYILDELDAALDDANVNRFADYLEKLATKTQFVVITHRKGTMQAADALYGVTMEESGVSQLVSLQLSELAG
ncbi:chromosome segregation protein SMC [Halanaerobaculum tunisiense]